VIYVGCSESSQYDQVLEEVLVGPVSAGCHKFVLQADAPDPSALKEILGVTVVLITCSYRDNEFVRIGYYVNNELPQDEEHVDQVMLDETLLDIRKIVRTTLADKPRVTRFSIPWNTGANSEMVNPESPIVMSKQVQEMMDDEARLVTDDDMELEI
jgi:histone chaperone ASF1